jgi:hypothetical protein
MKYDSNINLRLSSELRTALDVRAAEESAKTGMDFSSSDLLRVGAWQILARPPGELFRPPAVEHHP